MASKSRHLIDTVDVGGEAGAGLPMAVRDMDGDGDMDGVTARKSGLFLAANLSRSRK